MFFIYFLMSLYNFFSLFNFYFYFFNFLFNFTDTHGSLQLKVEHIFTKLQDIN